ncbi:hypothetical protein HK100_003582 [Physocladia obscura]|uniref:glucan endo-1,6-beta-glucosidase n=1 Tax=Physocladia obscura TaxID=109957 RepID=A0AAD5XDG8_9FUNG|nr:hypothetical protein HK100_003582 [Physocladia obscura]
MASTAWSNMGCGAYQSEFDCVSGIGQTAANAAFAGHWSTWITQSDITQMTSYGINTIRIPVGYWIREDIVYSSEHFPQGGLAYLQTLCGWASDAGLYIIIDLHGAPYAQQPDQPFTGQYAPTAEFYQASQYERALEFLEWMTNIIHTNTNYRNVGMLEIVNEPLQNAATQDASMLSSYYPNAFTRIRAAETAVGVAANNYLHIQMMGTAWGSGNPTQYLTNNYFAAYDNHRYLKWSTTPTNQASYIATSCTDDVSGGNWPIVVGEFSLSVPDAVQDTAAWATASQQAFYTNWFAAQVKSYETQLGWIFWSWKTDLGDYRWDYQAAVAAGVIPANLASLPAGVCVATPPAPAAGAWESGNGGAVQWQSACDWTAGDISNALSAGADCGTVCLGTASCTHFTWSTYNGGTCWLKSFSSNPSPVSNTNSGGICGYKS